MTEIQRLEISGIESFGQEIIMFIPLAISIRKQSESIFPKKSNNQRKKI